MKRELCPYDVWRVRSAEFVVIGKMLGNKRAGKTALQNYLRADQAVIDLVILECQSHFELRRCTDGPSHTRTSKSAVQYGFKHRVVQPDFSRIAEVIAGGCLVA